MELETGTAGIVRLAWSRMLGLEDTALAEATGERLYCVDNAATTLTFVRLFGQEILAGPEWAANAAVRLSGEELARHATLVRLSRDYGGHGLGEAALFFSDDVPTLDEPGFKKPGFKKPGPKNSMLKSPIPETPAFEAPTLDVPAEPAVSTDATHARALEAACPPDDASEAGLAACGQRWVLMLENHRLENTMTQFGTAQNSTLQNDGGNTPLAGAGYDIWAGILAHFAVLTAPAVRRRGYARRISAIAVEEALASGLIPQWRARTDNVASQATARDLGFVESGSQTSVRLPVTTPQLPG